MGITEGDRTILTFPSFWLTGCKQTGTFAVTLDICISVGIMNTKVSITFLAVVLAVMVQVLSAKKCYVCSTFKNEDECTNPDESMTEIVKDCADVGMPNATYCRKVQQDINIDGEDTTRTLRHCAMTSNRVNEDCLERTGTYRFKSWYCECSGDLCNTATSSQMSMVVMSLSAALGFIVKRFV